MATSKVFARLVLLLLFATFQYAAEKRDWNEGTLVSETVNPVGSSQRYQYIVSDGKFRYTIEYDHPLKALVHKTIKLTVEKDRLVVLDVNGKEYPAHIDKREPLIFDPPPTR